MNNQLIDDTPEQILANSNRFQTVLIYLKKMISEERVCVRAFAFAQRKNRYSTF